MAGRTALANRGAGVLDGDALQGRGGCRNGKEAEPFPACLLVY